MHAPAESLIAFATAPGRTAEDGNGANSLFSETLARMMRVPGIRLNDFFFHVRVAVREKTDEKQIPWEESSLTVNFMFSPPPPEEAGTPTESSADPPSSVSPREKTIAVVVIDGEISKFNGDAFKRRLAVHLRTLAGNICVKRCARNKKRLRIETCGCSLHLEIDQDDAYLCTSSSGSSSDSEADEFSMTSSLTSWLGSQLAPGNIEIVWVEETSGFAIAICVPTVIASMLWQLTNDGAAVCREMRIKAMSWEGRFVNLSERAPMDEEQLRQLVEKHSSKARQLPPLPPIERERGLLASMFWWWRLCVAHSSHPPHPPHYLTFLARLRNSVFQVVPNVSTRGLLLRWQERRRPHQLQQQTNAKGRSHPHLRGHPPQRARVWKIAAW